MYSIAELHRKNANYPWIDMSQVQADKNKNYTLYATGEATLQSGRIYVALPSTVKMDEETKKKFNIM
jgi:hypothetical protein